MKNIFIQYFKHQNIERCKEIDRCVIHNINSNLFDNVYILLDKHEDYMDWMKLCKVDYLNRQPTVYKLIDYINNVTKPDDINILCNIDIMFDDTIHLVDDMNIKDFFALTRWDIKDNKIRLHNVECSQDVWIWKGIVDMSFINLKWKMGRPGIDNLICGEFHKKGYKVMNPCYLIKTYHLHETNIRDYNPKQTVKGDLYFLKPTDKFESTIRFWKKYR